MEQRPAFTRGQGISASTLSVEFILIEEFCKIPIAMPSSSRLDGLFIDIMHVQQKDAKAKCHLVTWRRSAQASDHQKDTGDLFAKCSIVLGVSKSVKREASPASTPRIYTDTGGFFKSKLCV